MAKSEYSGFSKIIGVLFIASLILNVYLYMKDDSGTTDPEPCAGLIDPDSCGTYITCPGLGSFNEDPRILTEEDIVNGVRTFKEDYGAPEYGGIISGHIIDSLFSYKNTNGLGYAIIVTDDFIPKISLGLGGISLTIDEATGDTTIVGTSGVYFLNDLWCPPGCLIAE
jgi:hypothetical protein